MERVHAAWHDALDAQVKRLTHARDLPWELPSLLSGGGIILFSITSFIPATLRGSHIPLWANIIWASAGVGSVAWFVQCKLARARPIPLSWILGAGLGECRGCSAPVSVEDGKAPAPCTVCGERIPDDPESRARAVRAAAERLDLEVEVPGTRVLRRMPDEGVVPTSNDYGCAALAILASVVLMLALPAAYDLLNDTVRGPTPNGWVLPALMVGYGLVAYGYRRGSRKAALEMREFDRALGREPRPLSPSSEVGPAQVEGPPSVEVDASLAAVRDDSADIGRARVGPVGGPRLTCAGCKVALVLEKRERQLTCGFCGRTQEVPPFMLERLEQHEAWLHSRWTDALRAQRKSVSPGHGHRVRETFALGLFFVFGASAPLLATRTGTHLPTWVVALWAAAGVGSCAWLARLLAETLTPPTTPELIARGLVACKVCDGPFLLPQGQRGATCPHCDGFSTYTDEQRSAALHAAAARMNVSLEPRHLAKVDERRSAEGMAVLFVLGAITLLALAVPVALFAVPDTAGPTSNAWVLPTLVAGYGAAAAWYRQRKGRGKLSAQNGQ